jgi:hypothetical protein
MSRPRPWGPAEPYNLESRPDFSAFPEGRSHWDLPLPFVTSGNRCIATRLSSVVRCVYCRETAALSCPTISRAIKSETPAAFSIVTPSWRNELVASFAGALMSSGRARRIQTAYSEEMTLYFSAIGVDQIFVSYRRTPNRDSLRFDARGIVASNKIAFICAWRRSCDHRAALD